MEDCQNQQWDKLIPDLLGFIFMNLSLEEMLSVIPCVCKSWREILLEPYCWRDINICEWSKRQDDPKKIHRMLEMLISRSAGSLHKLSIKSLPNESCLCLIAEHGEVLQTLELTYSDILNSAVVRVAERFSALKFLDLSFCFLIGASGIEAVGKYCSNLTEFCRIIPSICYSCVDNFRDYEALAIASTMQKLKRLKIGFHIDTKSTVKILENCRELELLDMQNCCGFKWDEKLIMEFSKVTLLIPKVNPFSLCDACYEIDVHDEFDFY